MGHIPLYQAKLQKMGRSLLWYQPVRFLINGITLKNQHKLCNCAIMKLVTKQPNKMGHIPLYESKLQKMGRSLLWYQPVRFLGITLKNQHKLCNCAIMKLATKQPNLVKTHTLIHNGHT